MVLCFRINLNGKTDNWNFNIECAVSAFYSSWWHIQLEPWTIYTTTYIKNNVGEVINLIIYHFDKTMFSKRPAREDLCWDSLCLKTLIRFFFILSGNKVVLHLANRGWSNSMTGTKDVVLSFRTIMSKI